MSLHMDNAILTVEEAVRDLKLAADEQKAKRNRVRAGRLLNEIDNLGAMKKRLEKIERQIQRRIVAETPPLTADESFREGAEDQ